MDIINSVIFQPVIALASQTKLDLINYLLLRTKLRIFYKYPIYLFISIAITSVVFLIYYLVFYKKHPQVVAPRKAVQEAMALKKHAVPAAKKKKLKTLKEELFHRKYRLEEEKAGLGAVRREKIDFPFLKGEEEKARKEFLYKEAAKEEKLKEVQTKLGRWKNLFEIILGEKEAKEKLELLSKLGFLSGPISMKIVKAVKSKKTTNEEVVGIFKNPDEKLARETMKNLLLKEEEEETMMEMRTEYLGLVKIEAETLKAIEEEQKKLEQFRLEKKKTREEAKELFAKFDEEPRPEVREEPKKEPKEEKLEEKPEEPVEEEKEKKKEESHHDKTLTELEEMSDE